MSSGNQNRKAQLGIDNSVACVAAKSPVYTACDAGYKLEASVETLFETCNQPLHKNYKKKLNHNSSDDQYGDIYYQQLSFKTARKTA